MNVRRVRTAKLWTANDRIVGESGPFQKSELWAAYRTWHSKPDWQQSAQGGTLDGVVKNASLFRMDGNFPPITTFANFTRDVRAISTPVMLTHFAPQKRHFALLLYAEEALIWLVGTASADRQARHM